MIDTVVSVKLPIGEMLRIKRNRLMPDVVTGEEKRICLVSGIYGDELGGQYICGEIIRRINAAASVDRAAYFVSHIALRLRLVVFRQIYYIIKRLILQ